MRLEAIRLDQQRLVVAEDRFQPLLDLGRYPRAIPELEAFVAAELLRERARAQLMQAVHWTGRQPDALRTYREYLELLGEQLGLEPSLQLKTLEESILSDSLERGASASEGEPRLAGRLGLEIERGPGPAALEQAGWDRLWELDHDGSVEARQRGIGAIEAVTATQRAA